MLRLMRRAVALARMLPTFDFGCYLIFLESTCDFCFCASPGRRESINKSYHPLEISLETVLKPRT